MGLALIIIAMVGWNMEILAVRTAIILFGAAFISACGIGFYVWLIRRVYRYIRQFIAKRRNICTTAR